MAMSSVTIRVDEQTKREVADIADYFGFDLSSITRAFYKQIVREGRIPLSLMIPQPNDESLASIKEADEIIARGTSRYGSLDEMIADLEA